MTDQEFPKAMRGRRKTCRTPGLNHAVRSMVLLAPTRSNWSASYCLEFHGELWSHRSGRKKFRLDQSPALPLLMRPKSRWTKAHTPSTSGFGFSGRLVVLCAAVWGIILGSTSPFMVNKDAFRAISFRVDIKITFVYEQRYGCPANVLQPRLWNSPMYVNPPFCLCNACRGRISTIDCVLPVHREGHQGNYYP